MYFCNCAYRDVGDGLFEMEYTVVIDSNLLKQFGPISYKYLVHSKRDEGETSPYEFLHGAPGGRGPVINRKLVIEAKDFKQSGMTLLLIVILP